MERSTPVRKSHTSTADLLAWPENPPEFPPASTPASRSHQPSDGIQKVVFGGQVTDDEVESLNKRKPCSGYKLKEMTGSGIFASTEENDLQESENANITQSNKSGVRMYQKVVSGMSQISFAEEETVSTKKPTTLPEVAKQRELSGSLENEPDSKLNKHLSEAKNKELSGHDIFAPPPEIKPRPLAARALALRESITIGEPVPNHELEGSKEAICKTAKKIPGQKLAELSGNGIFKGDTPPTSADKHLSSAKLREMSGSNIFADGKAESRDYYGGVRNPPGGVSSIALV
ncbi:unnamed protein product [Cuscuta europaea]|uniref:DUF4057 domain-containing protein n=1 Tax=Cuscuta europaea TaxID=41803 RepID=A0A9P1EFI5_CUSEU|nr:unnamed protein product [Cuscuta europaea]